MIERKTGKGLKVVIVICTIAAIFEMLLMTTGCTAVKKSSRNLEKTAFAKAEKEENKGSELKTWDFGTYTTDRLETGYEPSDPSRPMVFVNAQGDTTQVINGKKTQTRTRSRDQRNAGSKKVDTAAGKEKNSELKTTTESEESKFKISIFPWWFWLIAGLFFVIAFLGGKFLKIVR